MRRMARRVMLWMLNSRPRWWESMWVFGIEAALIAWRALAVLMDASASSWTAGALVGIRLDGSIIGDYAPDSRSWDVRVTVKEVREAGWSQIEVPPIAFTPIPPTVGAPSAELRTTMLKWLVDSGKLFGDWDSTSEPRLQIARKLFRGGASIEERRSGWRTALLVTQWAATVVLILCPVLGCARGVQGAWYRQQLLRLGRGHCPHCDYELLGLSIPKCPECGTVLVEAAREAHRALRTTRGSLEERVHDL